MASFLDGSHLDMMVASYENFDRYNFIMLLGIS